MGKVPRKIKLPEGAEAYSRIESARGDMQYDVVAGPGENAHRVKIRTGSFTAMGIIVWSAGRRGFTLASPPAGPSATTRCNRRTRRRFRRSRKPAAAFCGPSAAKPACWRVRLNQ